MGLFECMLNIFIGCMKNNGLKIICHCFQLKLIPLPNIKNYVLALYPLFKLTRTFNAFKIENLYILRYLFVCIFGYLDVTML